MSLNGTRILVLFLFTGVLHPNQSFIKTNNNNDSYHLQDSTSADDIEIEGIIVDATQTKIGKDFYDLFYQQWSQIESLPYHLITIREKALPQLGSQISVKIEDQLIFRQVVQPRYEKIEEMASYALQRAYQYVINYDDMQKQLQGEDLQGTGIY